MSIISAYSVLAAHSNTFRTLTYQLKQVLSILDAVICGMGYELDRLYHKNNTARAKNSPQQNR